ncbi:GGDEF domain-containing protein [Paracoccus sp. T5]|uniref:GGDEF domain-containing protein n=1 Tax=Paracoccus sp. T5 TaxID=3402161 RepID=UPI003AEDCAE8
MTTDEAVPVRTLARLMPMHLLLASDGHVLSVGPTLDKVVPNLGTGLAGRLAGARGGGDPVAEIRTAIDQKSRLFLRVSCTPDLVLRGNGVRASAGSMLCNLGFGIGIHRAIRNAGLTDGDFAPSELAMELLFLHEANRGVLTELSRFNDQLVQSRRVALLQAQTDPLTGLGNRRGLEMALAMALRSAGEGPDAEPAPFAVVHLDLDHFKQVNDILGHKAGDDLLQAVGGVLRAQVRKADTAARIGGDEFVLILSGMTSVAALHELARRIIEAIGSLTPPGLGEVRVSASIGIVVCRGEPGASPGDLLVRADEALYESKHKGRGCATIRQ